MVAGPEPLPRCVLPSKQTCSLANTGKAACAQAVKAFANAAGSMRPSTSHPCLLITQPIVNPLHSAIALNKNLNLLAVVGNRPTPYTNTLYFATGLHSDKGKVMYAVISTGGKQYKVRAGDTLKVERLTAEQGSTVEFDKVLLVEDDGQVTVGAPFVEGGRVSALVTSHGRHAKIKVVKFKRRKKYRRTQGHRQFYTEVAIKSINGTSGSMAAAEG